MPGAKRLEVGPRWGDPKATPLEPWRCCLAKNVPEAAVLSAGCCAGRCSLGPCFVVEALARHSRKIITLLPSTCKRKARWYSRGFNRGWGEENEGCGEGFPFAEACSLASPFESRCLHTACFCSLEELIIFSCMWPLEEEVQAPPSPHHSVSPAIRALP